MYVLLKWKKRISYHIHVIERTSQFSLQSITWSETIYNLPNDDTSRYFIDHTVHGTMGAPYDIDDTIRLGAPYNIDATVWLGAPYDIGHIVSTDYFFSTKKR